MNIAEEIAKLEELHRKGTLNDDEFSRAKAVVLEGKSAGAITPGGSPPQQSWAKNVRWGFFVLLAIGIIAFVTNPDEAKYKHDMAIKDQRNLFEKATGAALADVSFERTNYFLFSTGKLNIRLRLTGEEGNAVFIGAFGRWWYDYPVSTKKI